MVNVLSETYIFYADVYFVQNFFIKVAALYLACYCNKYYFAISSMKAIGKMVCVAGVGTFIEIVVLLLGSSYNMFIFIVNAVEVPFMVGVLLARKWQQIPRVIAAGYFFILVINGALEVLWNWFGEIGNYVLFLVIASVLVYEGVRIGRNFKQKQKGIYTVEIMYKRNSASVQGFYDSGNCLKDPYTKKGVHIVTKELVERLAIDVAKMVYVPYQALGNEDDVIPVFYVDKMRIFSDSEIVEFDKVPVGVTKDNLFDGKSYAIILNEEVF